MQMIAQAYRVVAENPLDLIAFEECLLHSWKCDSMLLLFYVNSPSVIIGRNQNYWREVSPLCKVPVYRRSSGGGAVYHDAGNLNWALIVPRVLHSQHDELSLMAKAISELGVYARPGDRGGIFIAMEDGETQGKISGTARRFGTRNVLHHGTLLVATDLQALRASLGGIRVFEDLSIASVPAHPVNLSRFVPSLSVDEAASRISVSLSGVEPRGIRLTELLHEPSSGQAEHISCKSFEDFGDGIDICIDRKEFDAFRDRFGSPGWICGQSPPFSMVISQGKARAIVRVVQGKIAEISPLETGDRASVEYADMLQRRFVGVQFDFKVKEMLEGAFTSKSF
jgi:lipoyltransferase/lipoate-protein ligase